jgi:virulence-associated protein VagC
MYMKSKSPVGVLAAGIMAGLLVLAGCSDVFQGPQEAQGSGGEGRVTITIDGGARTVLPQAAEFSRFEVTIAEQGGSTVLEPVETTEGKADLVLPLGAWDVRVWAYNQDQPAALVAQAANTLTNTGSEVQGNTHFVLEPAGTGQGVLAYRITKPEGSVLDGEQSRIQIEQNRNIVKTIDFSDSVEGEIPLEPGRYIVDLLLTEGTTDKVAAQRETVMILPGLSTVVTFAPVAFLEEVNSLTFTSLGRVHTNEI